MFRYEKEMIPILREHLSKKYQIKYFINEFNSGNGIADLVFTTKDVNKYSKTIFDYDLIEIILANLNRKNKKINILKFNKNTYISAKQSKILLEFLIENGNLERIDENVLIVKEKYSAPTKNIISIEAKLSDWKNGLYQAMRYRTYSNKSYLALSEKFIHRVDLNLLKDNGIGLMSVSPNQVNIIIKATTKQPTNQVAYTYLSEKFARLI